MKIKRQSIDAKTKMRKTLQLSDKDFKEPMIKCFSKQLWTQLKQVRRLSKEIEGIKENRVEILKLNNTILKIKSSVDGFNNRVKETEKRISVLEDTMIEITTFK